MKRRDFVRLACVSSLIPVLDLSTLPTLAASEVSVDEEMAKALNYVLKADDAKDHPKYQKGQLCSNCMFFNSANTSCALFANRMVKPEGWCASWVKKAA